MVSFLIKELFKYRNICYPILHFITKNITYLHIPRNEQNGLYKCKINGYFIATKANRKKKTLKSISQKRIKRKQAFNMKTIWNQNHIQLFTQIHHSTQVEINPHILIDRQTDRRTNIVRSLNQKTCVTFLDAHPLHPAEALPVKFKQNAT